jgi:nitric oxide reductase NorE protein
LAKYLVYRGHETPLFQSSQKTLVQGFGALNTLVLLASSLFVVLGLRAMQRQQSRIATWMFVGAIGCGIAFSVSKCLEWGAKIGEGLTPATNNFTCLTGLHFFHLVVGLGVLAFLAWTARTPNLSPTRYAAAEGSACYWHMVDALWIVLFPLLYLIH